MKRGSILLGCIAGLLLCANSMMADSLPYPIDTVDGKIVYKYTVEPRVGLYSISKKFGVSQAEIIELNPIIKTKGLFLNDVIFIPTGQLAKSQNNNTQSAVQPRPQVQSHVPTAHTNAIVSDVDINIPQTSIIDNNTYVLIIANESYRNVDPVPFAVHDGEIFRKYCEQTLGITAKNHIKLFQNATLGDIYLGIDWLKQAMSINSKGRAIVYYTGHGIPDEANKSAYILPTDGYSTNLRTAYSLDELYNELGATNRVITVFLDACFSGAKRDGKMLATAKGIAIKTKAGEPKGKTVVFSASTGDETAGFYHQQQHGMFTYWLLKELQQTEGIVTYDQLGDFLMEHVRQSSFDENGKMQTPTITAGPIATDWQNWTLK